MPSRPSSTLSRVVEPPRDDLVKALEGAKGFDSASSNFEPQPLEFGIGGAAAIVPAGYLALIGSRDLLGWINQLEGIDLVSAAGARPLQGGAHVN